MAPPEDVFPAKALSLAEEVFARGKETLLAHAVRAVEGMMYERRKKPLPIEVTLRGRMSSRATLCLLENNAKIFVNEDIGFEEQRLAVAHELGHILLAFELIGHGEGLPSRVDPSHELWCRDFEVHLCELLHYLYKHTEFVKKTLFSSLDQRVSENEESLKAKMHLKAQRRK